MTDSRLDFSQPITQDYILMGKWGKNPYRLIFDMQGKGEASLGSYEAVSEAFAKEPTKDLSVHPKTETYYAIWAKEAANVEASATLPVCGDQVTEGKVASDPNVLIYKDD